MRLHTIQRRLCLAALCCACSAQAQYEDPEGDWMGKEHPIPPGVKLSLAFDRPEYFIGENVLAHLTIENTGDKPFTFSEGGDYRGAGRATRFKVTAEDEKRVMAEDPIPNPMCFGGMCGTKTLKPGEKCTESLPLMWYRMIGKAGRYTVRVSHDFGWKEDAKNKYPVGEATVAFRMPTAREAEQVLAQIGKMPACNRGVFGERTPDYADYGCLRDPVYLPALTRMAKAGNMHGLEGIESIETPEATRALLALITYEKSKVSDKAMKALVWRLPNPRITAENSWGGKEKLRIVARSWDTKLTPAVRALATRLLAAPPSADCVVHGAGMFQAIGTKEDAAVVLDALDRALEQPMAPRCDPKDNILNNPNPIEQLLWAMDALHDRGYELDRLSKEARPTLYFRWLSSMPEPWLQRKPSPRPADWLQRLEALDALGERRTYTLREAAMRAIPQPLPADCKQHVLRGLADRDGGVCMAACEIAGTSGDKDFLKPLLAIVATSRDQWLLGTATEAAGKLGAGTALHAVWLERLAEEDPVYGIALHGLVEVLDIPKNNGGGSSGLTAKERLEVQAHWKAFFAKHGKEIAAGKKFSIKDPAVSTKLVGKTTWNLEDGTTWPEQAK